MSLQEGCWAGRTAPGCWLGGAEASLQYHFKICSWVEACVPTSKSTDGCVSCGSLGGQDCSLIMAKRDWSQATSHFKSTTTGQRLVGLLHETWVDVSPSKSLERWYHLVVGARLNGAVSEFTGGQGYCTVNGQDHSGLNLPLWQRPVLWKWSSSDFVSSGLSQSTTWISRLPQRKFYLWMTAKLLSLSRYKKRGTTLLFCWCHSV